MALLSVVIPTHWRADILAQCLECLERQTIAADLDVIVVSDGHDDKTAALFVSPAWRLALRFIEVSKSQQGVARNAGVALAVAPRTLFIGDDILLDANACAVHAKPLQADAAVLGFSTWDPACGITPVMRWLEASGWQFGYPKLARYAHAALPTERQHLFTYTSHISLPTPTAKAHAFREDVRMYGWEDVEWGMRLCASGVPLFYEPSARALHHHHIELPQSLERMRTLGRSAVELKKSVPHFDRVPSGAKLLAYQLLGMFPTMAGKHRRAFLEGCLSL
jgi:glycosyltransferase involved in cell wall biosynthesis